MVDAPAPGPIQAALQREQELKCKLQERSAIAMERAVERRSSLMDPPVQGTFSNPVVSAATNNQRRSSAPGLAPRSSISQLQPNNSAERKNSNIAFIENLRRPTVSSGTKNKSRAAGSAGEKLQRSSPEHSEPSDDGDQRSELWTDKAETEEIWEGFHKRTSTFIQDREMLLEGLRKQREEKEVEGCTFEPATKARPSRPTVSGSMYDRAQQAEARKAEKMKRMRQELFDREMAQCSFKPNARRSDLSSQEMESAMNHASKRSSNGKRMSVHEFFRRSSATQGSVADDQEQQEPRQQASASSVGRSREGPSPALPEVPARPLPQPPGGREAARRRASARENIGGSGGAREEGEGSFAEVTALPPGHSQSVPYADDGEALVYENERLEEEEDDGPALVPGYNAPPGYQPPVRQQDQKALNRRRLLEESLADERDEQHQPRARGAAREQAAWARKDAVAVGSPVIPDSPFGVPLDRQSGIDAAMMASPTSSASVFEAVERMEGLLLGLPEDGQEFERWEQYDSEEEEEQEESEDDPEAPVFRGVRRSGSGARPR